MQRNLLGEAAAELAFMPPERKFNYHEAENLDALLGRKNVRPELPLVTDNNKALTSSPLTHFILYSEDMRISKILRRLMAENNPTTALDLCKKLETAVRTQSNVAYICRSFEFLLENMISVLKQCPAEVAAQASTVLGLIGYINRADFTIFKNYITKAYQSYKRIQKYIMQALKTTFSCDAVNLDLAIYSERLLVVLKDYLENAEVADIFIAVSETIAEFSKNYKRAFENHFTDIVDIVVGWHLEVEQSQQLKLHCSVVLQQFAQYFLKELDFTFGLLGQFLEDIVAFGEDVAAEHGTQKSMKKAEVRVGSFVGAFTSILKSLATKTEIVCFTAGQSLVNDAVSVIMKAAKQTLCEARASEETILNVNDFLCLIFANNYDTVNMPDMEEIIELELKQLHLFNDQQKVSLLYLMLSVIRALRTQLPRSIVTLVFRTDGNPLASIKMTRDDRLYKLLLKIYHEVLIIKNVPLLQEAYKHITMDIDICVEFLETNQSSETQHMAVIESTLNFYLAALSALATQTSSIIGMYALHPSILELLISNCKAANMTLWSKHSTLHSALLNVLIVHCHKNHNYRPTSRLLTEHLFAKDALDDSNSPTSENFSAILKFLSKILKCSMDINCNNLNLLLSWTNHLLEECTESAYVLENNEHFVNICQAISKAALRSPIESAACMGTLLNYPTLNHNVLIGFRDVAIYMLDFLDPKVNEAYTVIFSRLPLAISLATQSKEANMLLERKQKLNELQHWYKTTTHCANLRSKYFKPFLDSIELSSQMEQSLERMSLQFFAKCWTVQHRESSVDYQQTACVSSKILTYWLQYESARYCVRNKLRTTIGKPQETFLAVEAIIMKYARLLANKDSPDAEASTLNNCMLIQTNTRVLLGFLECLEKHIYNASEGTAFAILPQEKPAKTFFRVNAHTCNEWFKRIRTAVNLIAIHSMEPAMVVRYSENILKLEKPTELLMDHTIVSLVWALLAAGETDSLQGLYVWLKVKTGKRYSWIQYAAEQAAGHKEHAAEGYANLLNENETKMDAYIKDFLVDQLFDCLYYTGQWTKMRELMKHYKAINQETNNLSNVRSEKHLVLIESLFFGPDDTINGDEGDRAVLGLSEWPTTINSETHVDPNPASFSYYNILRKLDDSCIAQTLSLDIESKLPRVTQEAIHKGLQESLRHSCITEPSNQLTDFIIISHVSQRLIDGKALDDFSLPTFDCSQKSEPSSTVLSKCLLWSLFFNQRGLGEYDARTGSKKLHSLYLDVAASARGEGNAVFCRSMLQRFFALKGFTEPLTTIAENVQNNSYIIDMQDADLLRGFSEMSKCMYANGDHQLDALNLGSAYCYQIMQQVKQSPQKLHYPDTSADLLLTMAEWLTTQRGGGNNSASNVMNSPQLQSLLSELTDIPAAMHNTDDDNINAIIPVVEKAAGKLIGASIYQRNDSGAAWCAFGNWCYRWGKKMVEAKNTTDNNRGNLSQRDLIAIKDIVGGSVSDELVNQIVIILNSYQLNGNEGAEDIETNEISSSELIEAELRKMEIFAGKHIEEIQSIIQIWRQAHKSVYAYYETATKAYFKYLAIETAQREPKRIGSHVEDCTFVTTTLRLLRLVVKHATGLQEVLEEGLRTTPLRPWKVIIPQLFSRLNHHEPYVRKSVSELLCRLAQDRPHLIIFPAVVGAQQELKNVVVSPQSQESKEETLNAAAQQSAEHKSAVLSTCFGSLLLMLSKQAPETVLHVQLLVKELKRITLLWEEYWMHSLAQLYGEYSALVSALEVESKKATDSHFDKIYPKYEILMQHLVADLQKISLVTEKDAETNYERNFQDRYSEFIRNTIAELKKPLNLTKPSEGWIRIKQLYSIFQQRSMRGSASTLKVSDLSPVLAKMLNTAISMPGVDTFEKEAVHIKSCDSTVYILPTKTKPKKLAFYGSDGRKYTYLFKGLEDLHLDERIMQFLSISNSMMARSSDSLCTTNAFKAHHYSVIPLGPQSGLISWVDGVTPLFAIYKKWQQRDIALKQQQKERPSAANQNQNVQQSNNQQAPAATRPSEIFYNKLTPLLAERNIKVTDPRKQWPLETLRRVLEELSKDTPKDLLSKELWCYATNASEWRKSVRSYAISVAVMSVIGYVIGLGDRHLDNVLIKLSTGAILHIDYNVCFEKGKTLRVPEKVPFRMTPNLEEALGITGVEGPFRLGCEHVLRTLRKERETLLTLLEAFVYDPLVDWTVSDDGNGTTTAARTTSAYAAAQSIAALNLPSLGNSKDSSRGIKPNELNQRKQDSENTKQTIGLRFNEIKPLWTKYKDEVHSKLLQINNEIANLTSRRQDVELAEQERDILTKQLAMVRELETLGSAMGSHALNTITQRYTVYKRDAEEFNVVKQGIQKYRKDLQELLETYFEDLMPASSPASKLKSLQLQLCEHQQSSFPNEFEVVRSLLDQSPQELQIYDQCDFARQEMDNTLHQESRSAMDCLQLLSQYASVIQFYPHSRLQQNRLFRYEQWYGQLLDEEMDPTALKEALAQCSDEDFAKITEHETTRALQYSMAMEKIWIELNFDLHKSISDLNEERKLAVLPPEVALDSIQSFLATNPEHHSRALHIGQLQTLSKANDSFLLFEQEALIAKDSYLLDQQIDYIDMAQNMCQSALPEIDAQSYEALQKLRSTLQSLRNLKSAFELPLPERIVRFFMMNTHAQLRQSLDAMCISSTCASTAASWNSRISDEFIAFQAEIHSAFDDFESRLKDLQQVTSDVLEQTADSGFKHFVLSRSLGRNTIDENFKYDIIAKIFLTVREHVESLNDNNVENIYDVRLIAAPIKDYVNHMQTSFICGLTALFAFALQQSISVSDVIKHNSTMPCTDDGPVILANAQTLCQNLFISLQHQSILQNYQLQVMQHTKWVDHYTFVASAHFWTNEQLLRSSQLIYGHIVNKDKLLVTVRSTMQSLSVWKHTIMKIQDDIEEHIAIIKQRLKWAVSANHSLIPLQVTFAEAVNAQKLRYHFHLQLATELIEYAGVMLQFEVLLSGNTIEADNTFLSVIGQWQDNYAKWRHSGAIITPVEQGIVQLLDPEGKVDQCWINNISGLLDEMTFSVQLNLANLEREEQTIRDNLYKSGQQLQLLIDTQIRLDIRHLLKMMSKTDKSPKGTTVEVGARVRQLQHMLKQFITKLNELQLQLISQSDYSENVILELKLRIPELMSDSEQNYNDLLQLVQRFVHSDRVDGSPTSSGASPTTAGSQNNNSGGAMNAGEKKVANLCEQKRNAYAVSVWKRIRMKLEGRDPDPNRRSTVAEQVDFIMREAMNPDNLAVLYEGWTPWV